MCLTLYKGPKGLRPHNDSNIRWKHARISRAGPSDLISTHVSSKYKRTGWNRAKLKFLTPKKAGFHVYLSSKDALCDSWDREQVILKLKVRGFLRAGNYTDRSCETWKQIKIISVHERHINLGQVFKKHKYRIQ